MTSMYMQNVIFPFLNCYTVFYMDALYVSEHRGNTLGAFLPCPPRSSVLARLVAMEGARWSCLIGEVLFARDGGGGSTVSGA